MRQCLNALADQHSGDHVDVLSARTRRPEKPGWSNAPIFRRASQETLIIARMGGKNGEDLLNIEIWPNNKVIAAHYRGQDQTTPIAQQDLPAPAQDVERIRRMLWRLRPDDSAPAERTIPLGCRWVWDAGFDWAVVCVREDSPVDLLQFSLPYPEYCETRAYVQAQRLIESAIGTLPPSTVVERFPPGRLQLLGTYSP